MYDIVHELTIDAPRDAVFEAITTAGGIARWWTADCAIEAREGATASFGLADGSRVEMRIDALDAPELVHLQCTAGPDEWVGTSVAFRIEPAREAGAGSVLRFWHGGWEYQDGLLPRVSFGWATDLDRLRSTLESTPA